MRPIKEIASSDLFFFYDTVSIEQGNEADLVTSILQPKKSLFYNRKYGAGISESINYPNAIAMKVGIPYDIVDTVSTRNTQVVDGTSQQKDRRFAASQESVKIEQNNKGEIETTVSYINFNDFEEQSVNISLPMGSLK